MAEVLLNNFFGRQFNSLNDLAINPRNLDIYFTDPSYGLSNNFRPAAGMQTQVWRYNDMTGAVQVAADGFIMPNGAYSSPPFSRNRSSHADLITGITFSPDGKYAYVTDTGIWRNGLELGNPSSMYVFPSPR
jgi:gluconolactonase